MLLHRLWPHQLKGSHNYRYTALKELSGWEWAELRRLVRARVGVTAGRGSKQAKAARAILRAMRRQPGGSNRDRFPIPARMLIGYRKESAILDALHPGRTTSWLPVLKRRKRSTVTLANFSLIDNPDAVFAVLHKIAAAEADHAALRIDFVDEGCLDVSAYLVLGLMRQKMIRFVEGGSITGAVRAMVKAVDMADFLSIRSRTDTLRDPTFVPFKVRHRRPTGSSTTTSTAFQPSTAEMLADDLVDTINRWLQTCTRPELSPDMMACVSNLVTEVLDNAVRHSDLAGRDGDWVIAGFLSYAVHPSEPERHSYFCSLAMASVGATIHESLSQCADPAVGEGLKEYVKRHLSVNRSATAEVLTTVFAMQDGVSRFPQGEDDSKGGVGLMDTVEFMNRIGVSSREHERPCMTLISGRACLRLQGAYQNSKDAGGGRRELWFNHGNTGGEPPDELHAHMLPHPFPGTIVALRFCIGASDVAAQDDRTQP